MCRIQLRLLFVAELWSFDCVFMYVFFFFFFFFFLGGGGGLGGYNLHSCTCYHSLRIQSRRCFRHKTECSSFLS